MKDVLNREWQIGDHVKVADRAPTRELGIANASGIVFGLTTPSSTGIAITGAQVDDFGVNVWIPTQQKAMWLGEELLSFVSHGAGGVMKWGDVTFVRTGAGRWITRGDKVRVVDTSATRQSGIANAVGTVAGWTTPPGFDVDAEGTLGTDYSIDVSIDERGIASLQDGEIEFVSPGAGQVMHANGKTLVRNEQGRWIKQRE